MSRAVEESLATYESKREAGASVLKDAAMDVDLTETINELETEMLKAAEDLQFEKAALLRDQIKELKRVIDGSREAKDAKSSPAKRVSYARRRKSLNR